MAIIAASVLDADFGHLRDEVEQVDRAGVDMFTLDVVDGKFAPSISFGDYVVASIRRWTQLPLEVHLMVQRPELCVETYVDVGADLVMFHVEASTVHAEIISMLRRRGRAVGLAVLSQTPVESLLPWIDKVDVINFLTVSPGFGGQPSAPDTFDRIRKLRAYAAEMNPVLVIEVDGGVKPHNAAEYVEAGADMLTVGTGIYRAPDRPEAVRQLRERTSGSADAVARTRAAKFLSRPPSSEEDERRRIGRLRELAQEIDASVEGLI